jgi:hypothetical protein
MDDWKGPLDSLPGRQDTLEELDWVTARVREWFADEVADGMEDRADIEKALYFLRHTQHHIGEFSTTARLLHLDGPSWIYLNRTPAILIDKA